MARFGSLGTQYFDDSGSILSNGLIDFFESGTTTRKNTYKDVNETIPNTNPVVLEADGRQPNIFFSGSAKAVLKDSDGVIIDTRDPVGETSAESAFSAWNSVATYTVGDVVEGSDGLFYISTTTANQGNDPAGGASPANWTQVEFIEAWNTNTTYSINDIVKASNGALYRSTTNLNSGNNPISDGAVNWIAAVTRAALGVDLMTKGSILVGNGSVPTELTVGVDGYVFKSNSAAATGTAWEPEASKKLGISERTSDSILVLADTGNLIKVTANTFTQTITAAATLGANWFVYYHNAGSGIVTLDPNASETINGAATLAVGSGQVVILSCDGANFKASILEAYAGDSRVIVATGNGTGGTNTSIRRFLTTQASIGTDITYADSAADGGSFTINRAGEYAMSYNDAYTGTGETVFGFSVNSSQLTTNIISITEADRLAVGGGYSTGIAVHNVAYTGRFAAGDVIRAHVGTNAPNETATGKTKFSIIRIGA